MLLTIDERSGFGRIAFMCLALLLVSLAFNIRFLNSLTIVLLVVLVVAHPNRRTLLREVFSNYFFLAMLFLLLVQAAGLFYAEDTHTGWKEVTKKAGIVAIPLFFCAFRLPLQVVHRSMAVLSFSLLVVLMFCLGYAFMDYRAERQAGVFFYHDLVAPFNHHAVFFSFLVFFCVVYWMEQKFWRMQRNLRRLLLLMLLFFMGMILLLSSKLVLILTILYLLIFAIRNIGAGGKKWVLPILVAGVGIVITLIALTNNPVKARFMDIARGNDTLFRQEKFSRADYFNGLQFRLLTWRFTREILREEQAWVAGVTPGDAQHLLNGKFNSANMYMGEDGKTGGFYDFNCHNLYLQTILESGIAGLVLLLVALVFYAKRVARQGDFMSWVFFLAMIAFSFVESVLSTHYAILLFLLFPLLSSGISEKKNQSYFFFTGDSHLR